MRHYSHVCNSHVFTSCDVNFGEYVTRKDDVLNDFLAALANALGCNLSRVRNVFGQLVQFSEKELTDLSMPYGPWADQLTPAETRVLVDAASFFKQKEEGGLRAESAKTHVFHYCNLNEGRTVTWVHFVD